LDIQLTKRAVSSISFFFAVCDPIQVIAVALPAVIISVIAVFFRRSLHDLHHGLLGLFLAITLTIMVTEVIKVCIDLEWEMREFV